MLKRIIKGTAELAGMALVLAGLVVCMCETAEMDKQLPMLGIGFGMIAIGAFVSCMVSRGEDDGMS